MPLRTKMFVASSANLQLRRLYPIRLTGMNVTPFAIVASVIANGHTAAVATLGLFAKVARETMRHLDNSQVVEPRKASLHSSTNA